MQLYNKWLKIWVFVIVDMGMVHAQDTIIMPASGNGGFYNTCYAMVLDNGADSNYTNEAHAKLTIAPLWVQTVSLYFEEFDTEPHFDSLTIYDGPGTNFAVIGVYSGNQLQGQTVSSTGNSITLEFRSDDIVTHSGWKAWVNCVVGIEEENPDNWTLYPNPANTFVQIKGLGEEEISHTFILDELGRIVLTDDLNVSTLTNGIYLLKVELKNGKTGFKKFIKV